MNPPNSSLRGVGVQVRGLRKSFNHQPVLKDLEGKPETAEQLKEVSKIGSGPFKLVRWKPTEEILLERNGEHFSAPKVERWIMRIVPNAEATLGMLKRGELNFIGMFGGDPEVLTKFVKDNPDFAIRSEVDIGFEYAAFNLRRAPFNDPNFRRALSLAIDREAIVRELWRGRGIVPNRPIAKGDNHYDESLPPLKYDPALAKQRLKEGGYKGEEVVIEAVDGHIASVKGCRRPSRRCGATSAVEGRPSSRF